MLFHSPLTITQHFIRTHMEKRDLEGALSCLSDTISWFGTGAFEVVRGKAAARQFLLEEITAFPAGYTIAFEEMTEDRLTEDSGTVFGRVLVTDHAMGSQMDCRITTTCVRRNGGFLIASLHMSLPSTLQQGSEYYPLTIAAQKIQQLKDDFFNTTIPGGLLCCDAEKGFPLRYINDFFIQLLGYQNQDDFLSATGGLLVNCLCPDENIAEMERGAQAMELDARRIFTYRVKTKSGEELWLRAYTHKYAGIETPALLCFCMDISDIIQLEKELKEQKAQLEFANAEIQTIIGNIPGGVHRCPLFDRIHVNYVSQGFEEMCGYTYSEIHTLFHDNYTLLLLEADRDLFSSAIRQLAEGPANRILDYRMKRKDGSIIRVVDHFRSVRMEDGKMWGFGVATDVTAQYETLAQLQLLTDSIPGGLAVYEYSPAGIATVYFSDGVCAMLGYSREEYAQIAAKNFAGMIFKEDLTFLRRQIRQVLNGCDTVDCSYRAHSKNGGYCWMTLRGTVTDRWEDRIRISAVLLDITQSKEASEKLRIRDEEYSLAIKQSGKIVYRYSIADKSVHMLHKSTDLFGFPPSAENIPESIAQMHSFAPQSIQDFIAFHEEILRGEKSGSVTLRRKLKSGEFGWCRASFTTLFSSLSTPVSAIISIEDITQQQEQALENALLRQNEELFQAVVSHSDRFIVKYEIQTHTAYLQPNTAAAFHVDPVLHPVPRLCAEQGGIAGESVQNYNDFCEALIGGACSAKTMIKMRRNGQREQWGWYRFDGSVIFDESKQPLYAVISFIEMTEQYEKELAYERMNQHVARLSKDALLYFETNLTELKIERSGGCELERMAGNLTGDPTLLLKTAVEEWLSPENRDTLCHFFNRDILLADFAAGKTEKQIEVCLLHRNQSKWVCITVEMIADPYTENVLAYVLFRDIDKIKSKQIRMEKQAETDGLTGLYNRSATEQKIRKLLAAERTAPCAFLLIDVDDLKTINDTLGHMQGDCALRAFADTLRSCFGAHALVGRIGGDEFLVFLQDAGDRQALENTMRTLVGRLSALCVGEKDSYPLHGSIGVAASSSHEDNFEVLYQQADTALYDVKRHGKNNYAFYTDRMAPADGTAEGDDAQRKA